MSDVPPSVPPPYAGPPSASGPDAGTALSYGWTKFQAYAGPLIAIILIPVAIQIVLSLVGQFVIGSLAGIIVLSILSELIGLAASIGIFNAALMITAGEVPDPGKAFSTDRWGEWIIFAFVFGLMIGVGLLLCGVGALVVIAIWGFAPYFFIEKRMSLGDALRASATTTGAVPGLRVALALTALVGFAGVLLCGVGLLVSMPIGYVGSAYLYRLATNQPVAP